MTPDSKTAEILKDLNLSKPEVLNDFRLAWESRFSSLISRREVMSGKAKFGIFGDGKELPQLALAKVFRKGDFRSGYYRDQTWMYAAGASSIQEQFAQLYANTDLMHDPASGGRMMNAHFATRMLNPDGSFINLTEGRITSADLSPTAAQMPRLVGLAYASRLYREIEALRQFEQFSKNGSEIAFGTIGNASCAEGVFWESINAIGVLKSPAVISIWDDGYGISVPNEFQMVKQNIGKLLEGFRREHDSREGYDLYTVRGWNYPDLIAVYRSAAANARQKHIPAIIHVIELTQPQGHSTSGSHERYKSQKRLQWEREHDCIQQMRLWMIDNEVATESELEQIESEAQERVEKIRLDAWNAYSTPIKTESQKLATLIDKLHVKPDIKPKLDSIKRKMLQKTTPLYSDIIVASHETLEALRKETHEIREPIIELKKRVSTLGQHRVSSDLYSSSPSSPMKVVSIEPLYSNDSGSLRGFEILNRTFDAILTRDPRVIAFGEDVGKIGDVNQAFAGLQKKHGNLRVSDTGIREATILGQAIGMALRGLRPIAEIQYLDYVLYALQVMSDDLATLRWRSAGGQMAPVIVRTRGHRLEGVWHSGSMMAGILNLIHGMHVLVPRNMVKAAGFYNTLLKSDDPALIVEVLNGYRRKEKVPDNLTEFTLPLGRPDIIKKGEDITVVTYGASCAIALAAAKKLDNFGISVEVIDVQTLLPFDTHGIIGNSLRKTNRILFMDEDVPGGTTAYMLQQVVEKQGGFQWLDSKPRTLSGKPHRPAYGSDGNYFSKPNAEEIFEVLYEMMHEASPAKFPLYYHS